MVAIQAPNQSDLVKNPQLETAYQHGRDVLVETLFQVGFDVDVAVFRWLLSTVESAVT